MAWRTEQNVLKQHMFNLAHKYSFERDEAACWLHASFGYNDDFSWQLHLQSQSALTRFPSESVRASFGIHTRPPLGKMNWRDLPDTDIEIPTDSLGSGFMFHYDMFQQWDNLVDLRLRFGQTRGSQIEVHAEGSAEAEQDIFSESEIGFHIETWAKFRGVAINVPLNAADPLSYSTARIETLLPQYAFSTPLLRQTTDNDGTVRVVEVLFRPDEE